MKKLILCLICILSLTACEAYYGAGLSVPGETRMDAKGKVLAAHQAFIRTKVSAKHKKGLICSDYGKNYKILDTKFTHELVWPYNGRRGWEEEWIVEACGTKWRVPIVFTDDVISTSGAFPLK
jgi:hypothetical protein